MLKTSKTRISIMPICKGQRELKLRKTKILKTQKRKFKRILSSRNLKLNMVKNKEIHQN